MSFKRNLAFWLIFSQVCPSLSAVVVWALGLAIAGFLTFCVIIASVPTEPQTTPFFSFTPSPAAIREDWANYHRWMADLERETNSFSWRRAKEYWLSVGETNRPIIFYPRKPRWPEPPPKE